MAGPYRSIGKRTFDVVASGATILVLSPVLLLTALLIRFEDGGPALFRQARVGRNGDPFTVLKFRSMRVGSANVPSAQGAALPITRIGRFLRRTNIDELPQLFNIFLGDMSVVGPRPPIPTQEALVTARRANGALALRPGLTGLAQIKSYDGMPESEKAECDGRYAQRVTFAGDLVIIVRTLGYLLHRPPVY